MAWHGMAVENDKCDMPQLLCIALMVNRDRPDALPGRIRNVMQK